MLELFRSYVLGAGGPEVIHECRECGTRVAPDADACPSCDATDVAEYEID